MQAMTFPVLLVENPSSISIWPLLSTVEAQVGVQPFNIPGQCYFQFWPLLWYSNIHSCYNTFNHEFVLHILLYLFVISCVQILYSQLSLRLPRENSALPLVSLSHQNCVKYIADILLCLTSLLEYNCFTMVCQFLFSNKVNQLYIYMSPYLFPLAPPSLPPSLSHHSRWSQSIKLISLGYAAASY